MADTPSISAEVRRLVEQALESGETAEEVCQGRPDLLADVQARLSHVRSLEGRLDALFPPTPTARTWRAIPRGALPEIPGYAIEHQVGAGGMGVVYRARHLRLKRPVAIKMVLAGVYATPAELECLIREAQACSKLQHPHIVQVFDVGEADGLPYFTMEFMEGGTLAAKLAATPMTARDAADLASTLASAVHAAHQAGIVHRDIKPANILLTADGAAKVGDFSLARDVGGRSIQTMSNLRVGTPSYMAPEQIKGGDLALKPTVDVYALGALLYEMLTGRPPFRGETPEETQRQVLAGDPAPPSRLNPSVPADLETVCLKALASDPRGRYASAALLADDLSRFVRGEPVTARRPSGWERTVRWVRRRPTLAMAIAASAIAAVTIAALAGAAAMERVRVEDATRRDLAEARESRRHGRWADSHAAIDRASARLGDRGWAVRAEIEESRREQRLVDDLAAVRMDRTTERTRDFGTSKSAARYAKLFADAGLILPGDAASDVAAKIAAKDIRDVLVAAVDIWSTLTQADDERTWLLEISRRADPDPWRDRLRLVSTWLNPTAAAELADTADVDKTPVQLLLILTNVLAAHDVSYPGRSIEFVKKVQAAHPTDFWVNFLMGEIVSENDPARAVGYFRAAIAVSPDAVGAYVNLGLSLIRSGNDAEALEAWDHVMKVAPTVGVVRTHRAIRAFQRLDLKEAIRWAREAVAVDPEDSDAITILGRALLREGQSEEAAAQFARALPLMKPGDAYIKVATQELDAAKLLVEYDKASEAEKAEGLRTSNGFQAQAVAMTLWGVGRASEAAPFFARALEVDPPGSLERDPHAWYNAACAMLMVGTPQDWSPGVKGDPEVWRERALFWLEEDLASMRRLAGAVGAGGVGGMTDEQAKSLRETITHWRTDPDLERLRKPGELPTAIAGRARALWAGIDELWVKAGGQ